MRNLLRTAALLGVVALIMDCTISGQTATAQRDVVHGDIKQVRRVLDAQVEAWNRGDIEGFMDGYMRSNETTFVSGDTVTRGWQTVLDRYRRGYDTREKMGTLAFSDLEIKALAPDHALADGRWQLTRTGETTPFARGRFSLIFRHTRQGWRIIHDHTSSAP